MAEFTMPLCEVIEATGGTVDFATGVAVMTGGDIGLGQYPIFQEPYRAGLNGKIIDHFYNREIGQETIEMFRLALRRKMNEIMPYYNQLYSSLALTFDPLSTVDITNISSGAGTSSTEVTSTATNEATNNSGSRTVSSETPQTMLSGNSDYASAASDVTATTTSAGDSTNSATDSSENTQNSESSVKGYQGPASELLMRYRDSMINIDLMVINDLETLFMLIWSNGDKFTKGYY